MKLFFGNHIVHPHLDIVFALLLKTLQFHLGFGKNRGNCFGNYVFKNPLPMEDFIFYTVNSVLVSVSVKRIAILNSSAVTFSVEAFFLTVLQIGLSVFYRKAVFKC